MAFTLNTFQFGRGVATAAINGNGVSTVIHGYKTDDTFSDVAGASYFPGNIDGSTDKVFVGDLISIVTSDTVAICAITVLDPFAIGSDLYSGAGSPIVMSVPVAATDANGIKISGTTVQLEIADATHPGAVTALDQNFAGIKMFNSGIKMLTFGGTPTTLNYYEEATHATTFTNSAETSASANLRIIRDGSKVTIKLPFEVTTPGQGGPGAAYISNTAIPARFRPVDNTFAFALVSNGGVFKAGALLVRSTGIIEVYNSADLTTAFTTSQINAFYSTAITYSIL